MIKDPRNFLWIVPLALLLTFPVWRPLVVDFLIPERKKPVEAPPAFKNPHVLAGAEMDGVQLEQSKNGVREWRMTAARLYSLKDQSDMALEDVQASFFDVAGKEEKTHVRSQRARYNVDTRKLNLQGRVLVQNRQGYEMRTESLEYAGAGGKIRTTSAVRLMGKNMDVSAGSLLYDLQTGNYRLEGNVVCRVW